MIQNNQLTRFIAIGVAGALIYFGCSYLLLTEWAWPPFWAGIGAYVIAFGFAYLGQKLWAFQSISPHRRSLPRYTFLQIGGAIFTSSAIHYLSLYTPLGPLIIAGMATIINGALSFVISSKWVFNDG